MTTRALALTALVWTLIASDAFAVQTADRSAQDPDHHGAGPVRVQVVRTEPDLVDPEVLDSLYSLDFDTAESKLQSAVEENPRSARLWNQLAFSIWFKSVYERQKRGLDRYMGSRLGRDRSNDRVSPEREDRLREVLDRAIEISETTLEEDPDNIEALYNRGIAYGMLASFEAMVKRAYLAANSAAKKAREDHLHVLRMDPSYNDARLTIGTYDYTLSVLPGIVRFILGVFGIRGDKEEGIRELEYAAELGDRGRTNAKMVLVGIYNREREYEKSLAVLEDLHSQYPRNFLLETAKASAYERLESWEDAIETYETVLAKVVTGENDYDRLDPEPLVFKIGEANVRRSQLDQALEAFTTLVDNENVDVKGRAHLWIGKVYDAMQERDRAIGEYDTVLSLDCSENLRDEARDLKRRPYRSEPTRRRLR